MFDGIGNPLPDITIQVGTNTVIGQTDPLGFFSLDIGPDDLGDTVVTIDGSTASDRAPDFLSGQYPTIPNKPMFIDGGVVNMLRNIALPERDLTE